MRKGDCVKHAFLVLIASTAPIFASITGTVVNQTTGKPQPGVTVTLVKPGQQGMRTIGTTTTGASGNFAFEHDEPGGGPQLLQANYKNVNYNKLMTPNIPTSGVTLDIYEPTASPSIARITQRMMIFEPSSSQIGVNETIILENDSRTTFDNDSLGAIRFYLPPAANGQFKVNAQGPQGMPLPRPAEKTDQENVFKVPFPVKPGETQFQITYVLPVGSPFTFQGRAVVLKGMAETPLRLIAPLGVTISGRDIEKAGTEPRTQASVYTVVAPDSFSAEIAGTGSLRAAEADDDASDRPQITEGQPQIYTHLPWLLALAFAILATGFVILFRQSQA